MENALRSLLALKSRCISTCAGILKLYQSSLLERRSIEDMGQFLGHLPSTMDSDTLFSQIDSIHFTPKRFKQILQEQTTHVPDTAR